MNDRVICLAAGGHARVVLDAARAAKEGPPPTLTIIACSEDDPTRVGSTLDGCPIVGPIEDAPAADGATGYIIGRGGTDRPGGFVERRRMADRAERSGLTARSVIHPSASIAANASIAPGAFIGPRAVVAPGASIGAHAIINSGAIIEHDAFVGVFSHIAPGAVICGATHIDEDVHVGAAACVLQGLEIGASTLIAAGAVVARSIPPESLVMGVPGLVCGVWPGSHTPSAPETAGSTPG